MGNNNNYAKNKNKIIPTNQTQKQQTLKSNDNNVKQNVKQDNIDQNIEKNKITHINNNNAMQNNQNNEK